MVFAVELVISRSILQGEAFFFFLIVNYSFELVLICFLKTCTAMKYKVPVVSFITKQNRLPKGLPCSIKQTSFYSGGCSKLYICFIGGVEFKKKTKQPTNHKTISTTL